MLKTPFDMLPEQEPEDPQPDFVKGFNEGYLLARQMPELAEKIAGAATQSERSQGFKSGLEQFEHEQDLNRQPTWMREDRLQSFDQDKDRTTPDRHKEDPDVERS